MLKYLKTSVQPKVLNTLLVNELRYLETDIQISEKLNLELTNIYKVDLMSILNLILKNIRCSIYKDDLIQIYIIDEPVKGHMLNDIIGFLNYGTLQVRGESVIINFINKGINKVKERIGGI